MPVAERSPISVRHAADLLLPLGIILLLIIACLTLLGPFLGLILWSIVFAICFAPVRARLMKAGLSSGMAALVLGLGLSLLILAPLAIAAWSAASFVPTLVAITHGDVPFTVAPPSPGVRDWPIVGERAFALWSDAAANLPAFLKEAGPKLREGAVWLAGQASGLAVTLLAAVAAIVIAAILLAAWERYTAFGERLLGRISGNEARGVELSTLIGATIRSVALGVVGVAFIQGVLIGAGLFFYGVPAAGIISLLAFFFAIVQVPAVIVTLPAIAWAWSAMDTTSAAILTVWLLLAGLSDNLLKPLLLARGLDCPMPVILLGVIGGMLVYGLLGLFIGPVLLAVGYVLFLQWMDRPSTLAASTSQD